jgi:hypothetical protein
MAGIKIEGGSSTAGSPNVDANFNLNVNLPATKAQAGFTTIQTELDSGSITGSRYLKSPFVSEDARLSVGMDTTQALYNFTSTTQSTGDFKHAFTTMTMTQSAGFLNINPALATVSGNYAYLQSWKHFTLQGDGQNHLEVVGQISAMPPANQILEVGFFLGTAGIAPADGAFFRLTSAGLAGIISYNGVETSTGVFLATVPSVTNGKYKILVSQREVSFWVDDVLGAELLVPAGQAVPFLWLNLPICFMMRNSGTVTGGMTTKIGTVHVSLVDLHSSKPWSEQMATQGNAYQGQEGDTQGTLAIYSNAALGAAAALSNTTAAAPNVGLGGVVLVLPTLTAGTDGILFSYQNPAGSATQPPKTLVVTGITLDATVQVAFTGGPLALVMGAAYGHTAVSLATTESSTFATGTTKAPRRVPLVTFGFPVTAAVGTGVTRASQKFSSPIVVNPGEFFAITCRNVGTVTTAGALVFTACVDHYFE